MRRDEVHEYAFVRLLLDHVTVPAGTTGRITYVGIHDGRWNFIVAWDRYVEKPLFPAPKIRPKIVYPGPASHSLRLSETDLDDFEIITSDERDAATATFDALRAKKKPALSPRNVTQLPLPFAQAEMFRNGVWSAE